MLSSWLQGPARDYRTAPLPSKRERSPNDDDDDEVVVIEHRWQRNADPWIAEIVATLDSNPDLGRDYLDAGSHRHVIHIACHGDFTTAHPRNLKWNSIWRGLKRRGYSLDELHQGRERTFRTTKPVATFKHRVVVASPPSSPPLEEDERDEIVYGTPPSESAPLEEEAGVIEEDDPQGCRRTLNYGVRL